MENHHLLELKNVTVQFPTENDYVTAVDNVSFHLERGEILGILGESGCGKSVTAQTIIRLLNEKQGVKLDGEIIFEDHDLLSVSQRKMEQIRGNEISFIFQDSMSALNPCFTIGNQISESFLAHKKMPKKEAMLMSIEILRTVGIPSPEKRVHEFPHQLSGGMNQRVMIAMALACQPKLLIADEPTTALDVTIQAQILNLMIDLKEKSDTSILMITHDFGVVAETCTRIVIMYLGQVVEEGDVEDIFSDPRHPYTIGLLKSIPMIDGGRTQRLNVVEGIVPSLHEIPKGCRFAPRCTHAKAKCWEELPELEQIDDHHIVRCWYHEEVKEESEGAAVK